MAVVVPAYNEADSIGLALADLRRHCPWADVVVVDDGSIDKTSEFARAAGTTAVLRLPVNLGIGGAVQAGYRWALAGGYDAAVQFDGDGQHRAALVAPLLTAMMDHGADQVVGSRFISPRGFSQYGLRRFGIWLLARLLSLLTRRRVTDPSSGFRVVNRRALALLVRCYPQDYPEPEVLVLLHRHGLKSAEIPAAMRHRRRGRSSITLFRGLFYMAKVGLAVMVDLFKSRLPPQEETHAAHVPAPTRRADHPVDARAPADA